MTKWINVKEKIPEEGFVLIYVYDDEICKIYVSEFQNGRFYSIEPPLKYDYGESLYESSEIDDKAITHYMPLPEFPREEKQ